MHAGQKLGLLVTAVINNGFLQTAETRSWIGSDVLDARRFDHVDHEVRTRPADHFIPGLFSFLSLGGGRSGRRRVCSSELRADDCRRAGCSTFQEGTAVNGLIAHDTPPVN